MAPISIRFLVIGIGAAAIASTVASAEDVCNHEDNLLAHVGHVMTCWDDTPDNRGLLDTASAEAAIARQHAELAVADPADLNAIHMHMRHVINAIDPELEPDGPGLGYGLILAADGAGIHLGFALQAESMFASRNDDSGDSYGNGGDGYGGGDDANTVDMDAALDVIFDESGSAELSEAVLIQATIASQSIANASTWAGMALTFAHSALERSDVEQATTHANAALLAITNVIEGKDLNGDGTIDVDNGEGGLDQARAAMESVLEQHETHDDSDH